MTAAAAIQPEALTGNVLRDWDEATKQAPLRAVAQVAQHAQFDTWARNAGFARTEARHPAGPTPAAMAYQD